jgi:hypothetical protein
VLDQLDTVIGFSTVMLAVSLLITTLTQAVLALLDTRGRNLRSGLKHLLANVAPSLKDDAADLSRRIVTHPLICDSATMMGFWGRATAIKREELIPILEQVLKTQKKALDDGERKAIEQWFDSAMTRSSQWFAMYCRWITVALAVVVAFAMHLDALAVFREIQRDSETRARLAIMSSTLLEESPGVVERVDSVRKTYLTVLQDLLTREKGRFKPATTIADPPTSRRAAADWIAQHAATDADRSALQSQFATLIDERLKEDLERALDRFNTTRADLAATGLSLYPDKGHALGDWSRFDSHFWGIVASVLLLSLGAPFWFNMLKNVSSLRTVVAQSASVAAGEQTPSPATSKAPLPPPVPVKTS